MNSITEIYQDHGMVMFQMSLYHMIDVGKLHLTAKKIAEAKEQILQKEEANRATEKIPIIGVDFQYAILDCAHELSEHPITQILLFVKQELYLGGE